MDTPNSLELEDHNNCGRWETIYKGVETCTPHWQANEDNIVVKCSNRFPIHQLLLFTKTGTEQSG